MPQRRSGIKDLRKNHTRKMQNLDFKTELRKITKKFLVSATSKNTEEARSNLSLLYKKLDKAAKRNLLHKNTVSRRKSKFSKVLASSAS